MHALHDPSDGGLEDGRLRQKADHEIGLAGKIEEESRMHDHLVALQQIEDQGLLAVAGGHPDDGRPATFRLEQGDRARTGGQRVAQRLKVLPDSTEDLLAHGPRFFEQGSRRQLDRRADRQIRVADQLESIECLGNERRRAFDRQPAQLHLRQPRRLGQPTEAEQETGRRRERGRLHYRIAKRIIDEHLVDNQRGVPLGTATGQQRGIGGRQTRSGRIVRRNRQDGAGPVGPLTIDLVRGNGPFAVILERVAALLDAVEAGEVIEQRIARHRGQHVRPCRIAQELEEQRVGLAGACRQHDLDRFQEYPRRE